jgi:diaminopimelate decarboxylase
MRQALAAGIGCFNVESEAELDVLSEVALAEGGPRAGQHPRQSRTSTRRRTPTSPPA